MCLCVGEHAVKQLEAHLARVRLGISKGIALKTLREAAKQEGKGLLRIAQAGLRNTAGGLGEWSRFRVAMYSGSLL